MRSNFDGLNDQYNFLLDFRKTFAVCGRWVISNKNQEGENGSFAMPIKSILFDFDENAEGNLGMQMPLLEHLAAKTPNLQDYPARFDR